MLRAVTSAILASAAMLASAGVSAQPTGDYYVATPATPATKLRLMTRETPWTLHDGAYVAAKAPVRDTILCQLMAREVGGLAAFSAGGKAFDATQIGTCNAKAGVVASAAAAPAVAKN